MDSRSKIDVFEYLDYRGFLRDYYLEQKARGRGFSYRAFSRRADLRAPNYLKLVVDGDRNLTQPMAVRFAAACRLDTEETEFFADLVAFGQAKTATERAEHYRKLTGSRKYRQAHELELAQADYHSNWYLPAVRELVAREDFTEDPDWISSRLRPTITPDEADKGIKLLFALGLLTRDTDGRIQQSEPLVSTGPEVAGVHIVTYHRAMIARGSAAIGEFLPRDRDISSLTLCLGADGLKRVKERLRRFRRELLELSALEDDPEQVVQMNFQLFPLSSRREDES